ncbi:TPA: hypothetical protein ACOTGW_001945 [Clostridium perfringens]|uniref:hypothetical protein n=1 Tax=Clostridium perfringens TaxID=1502 RepID=UPI0018EE47A9|nr:hypothetical protein [Clostridium perfringens]MBO3408000.1 hypothetical protein [Clostridium perfringens]MBO3430526.1 hypothetical protein [Clostridium perfringens]MDK0590329.1 hypothetical protein [Clostridium perfringens]MDK0802766.1 hypothetical protein [Clostridium perfringens]MDM0719975.1 hypothetical protein [Clostridium perfringens]
MKVNLLDMYTPHELGIMTYKDIAAKREKKDKEADAYFKIRVLESKKKWNVKFGGYRW